MKRIIIVAASLLFLGCGGQDQIDCVFKGKNCRKKAPNPVPERMVTSEQKEALIKLRDSIRTWVIRCEGDIACGENGSLEPDAGDSLLWAGLLCASGEQDQCDAAKASQNSETGQLYRNPGGSREKNDSSRDMLTGFLMYLTVTKDQDAGIKLLEYLRSHDYKLCDNATDNRCDFSPNFSFSLWGTMGKVWQNMGLGPTSEMKKGNNFDETITQIESISAPEGFGLHLIAIQVLIRQMTNSYNSVLQTTANNLLSRQPENPFFEYVAKGPTYRAADLVLKKCPSEHNHVRKQWAWQRAESEQAWLESKGWDCIYLINMLLK